MEFRTITVVEAGGVGTITLNRPQVMNALTRELRQEMIVALTALQKTARSIVVTGTGRAFCSGQDLGDFSSFETLDMERTLNDEYVPLLRLITECPVPIIAAVNGTAAGAGANLALACDVVIAAESASFIQAFTRIGLIPDAGGTYWLPRQIGLARAMGAALFAEKVSARQAADWGMIWEAVPDEDFLAHIAARASQLAAGPTVAYSALKSALRQSFDMDLGQALVLEAKLQGECGKTVDFREGVTAFLKKRAPRFKGA